MPKYSKMPELSDKRTVNMLIFPQFWLLNNDNKQQTTNAR